MKKQNVKGFTLIELMVVVAIIAILAAIAIPMIFQYRLSANRAKCIGNMKQIQNAVEAVKTANGGKLKEAFAFNDKIVNATTGYFKTTPSCPDSGTYALPAVADSDTWTPSCSKTEDPYLHIFQ